MEIIFALFFFTAFILAIFVFIIKPLFNLLFESTSSKSKLKNFASNALTEMAKRKEEKRRIKFIQTNEVEHKHKLCAYCHSGNLTSLEQKMGAPFWKYANLNGSQDMRRKDINYQLAGLLSDHECNDCGAITLFSYYASDTPNIDGPIYSRALLIETREKGIEKIGFDWHDSN